jgi:hypothetical protein
MSFIVTVVETSVGRRTKSGLSLQQLVCNTRSLAPTAIQLELRGEAPSLENQPPCWIVCPLARGVCLMVVQT